MNFDLLAEATRVQSEPTWEREDRNESTLIKDRDLHITLLALKGGARLAPQETAGYCSVHVLQGHVRALVDGEANDLRAHGLLAIARCVRLEVEAVEDTTLLLTLGSPESRAPDLNIGAG